MDMPNYTGKILNPTQRTTGNQGKLGAGEVVLPKEEHTNWFSSDEWSVLKE